MKAILMSIKPQYVAKILNGEKTIEIRKRFPKDYVGWVYIYCTKENAKYYIKNKIYNSMVNGKVVARFWCDKVENYVNGSKLAFENGNYIFGTNADFETILKPGCLTEDELYDYCEDLSFKAIHITKLEIFDKPKEISEFKRVKWKNCNVKDKNGLYQCHKCPYFIKYSYGFGNCGYGEPLTKAPQSYMYIEEGSQNEH